MFYYTDNPVDVDDLRPACCLVDCVVTGMQIKASWLKITHNGEECSFIHGPGLVHEHTANDIRTWLKRQHLR